MAKRMSKIKCLSIGGIILGAVYFGYWIGLVYHTNSSKTEGVVNIATQNDIRHDFEGTGSRRFNSPRRDHAPSSEMEISKPPPLVESPLVADKTLFEAEKGNIVQDLAPDDNYDDPGGEEISLKHVRAKMAQHHAEQKAHAQVIHAQPVAQQQQQPVALGNQQGPIMVQQPQLQAVNAGDDGNDQFYALIHNEVASRVHGKIHEHLKSLPDYVDTEAYILQSKKLPSNKRQWPSVGNGHIATAVHSTAVYMNGLYNGYLTDSHRAVIPSTCSLNITGTEPPTEFTRSYRLNVGEGIYSELSESSWYTLTHRLYAHRQMSRLLVVEIDLVRSELRPLTLQVALNKWVPSRDVTFLTETIDIPEISYKFGKTNAGETDDDTQHEVHVVYDHVPDQLTAPANLNRAKWVFLTAIARSKEEAFDSYKQGAALIKNNDALYSNHVLAWAELWSRGRIDVTGNLTTARALYASQYYLLSSLPTKPDQSAPFVGLSPSGLPYGSIQQDYQGHVFWDQETWMYPPVLFLHSDIARLLLGTRMRTANSAVTFAQHNGWKGMQYPWESAYTGWDVTPDANCSKYELHINGDISFAILQYLYATNDTSILTASNGNTETSVVHSPLLKRLQKKLQQMKNDTNDQPRGNVPVSSEAPEKTFLDILSGLAQFWFSKLTFNQQTKLYEIKAVMPPDEDAGTRDNSVYTNAVAQMALRACDHALRLVAHSGGDHWKRVADDIYIPFDAQKQYHPEYSGYTTGKSVKQADAILLGYPLMLPMPRVARQTDLSTYEKVTRPTGPAMTWGMFSIGWLELGDSQAGNRLFEKNFAYMQSDFLVWNEQTSGLGAANFLTGIGSFLQNVIFGYGGFRLHSNLLNFSPFTLPPGATSMHIVGVDYLGSSFDYYVSTTKLIITLTKRGTVDLLVYIEEPEQLHSLKLGQPVTLPAFTHGVIMAKNTPLPESA